MLAALPVDKARKFLESASKGKVLDAAWKALVAAGAIVSGLHVGFARYRSGLEAAAANVKNCDSGTPPFDASTMTVMDAAKCLGLSEADLFAEPKNAPALNDGAIRPRAFLMLMRGVAADCVALDFSGKGDNLNASQTARAKACNSIGFTPTPRPYRLIEQANKMTEVQPISEGTVRAEHDGKAMSTAFELPTPAHAPAPPTPPVLVPPVLPPAPVVPVPPPAPVPAPPSPAPPTG
jgi:hypothetical protein